MVLQNLKDTIKDLRNAFWYFITLNIFNPNFAYSLKTNSHVLFHTMVSERLSCHSGKKQLVEKFLLFINL